MSTRCNIDWNWHKTLAGMPDDVKSEYIDDSVPPFALESDPFEKDMLFLEITDCDTFPLRFDASPGRIEIAMPLALWNRLVAIGAFSSKGGECLE